MFNDLDDVFDDVLKGVGYVTGTGDYRYNPIDGNDFAKALVDAVGSPEYYKQEIELGGPDIFTQKQVVELAFKGNLPSISENSKNSEFSLNFPI